MKAVILAGGYGTRISEETHLKPKPMVEIGGKPMIWHIMKYFSFYGINDFIICCGYKGYLIKEYFANYFLHMADVTFDLKNNKMEIHQNMVEPWKVTLVDTGEDTMTGSRLNKIKSYIDDDFCFTYGDGLSNVNIAKLIAFHKNQGTIATVTAVQPAGKYGVLNIAGNLVSGFREKPDGAANWVNGGFFVLSRDVFNYIKGGDKVIWEKEPLEKLAEEGQLSSFIHHGYWQSMDTLREKVVIEKLWNTGNAPWKIW